MQLVVTATRRESDAVLARLGAPEPRRLGPHDVRCASGVTIAVAGVGIAEAAATTASLLAQEQFDAVFSIGVAGGHAIPLGAIAVADALSSPDTGVEQPDGTVRTLEQALGFGTTAAGLAADQVDKLAARLPGCHRAHLLTVSTVTGSAERARRLLTSITGAAVEDMEGWGVYVAATAAARPFFAVKAVSNRIGPRDRASWDLDGALEALSHSACQLFLDPPDWI